MKKIALTIMSICILFTLSGCSAKNDCDCSKKYLYRETIYTSTDSGWNEDTNLYEKLPENAEIIEIIDRTSDSHYPKYDIIYTIHYC